MGRRERLLRLGMATAGFASTRRVRIVGQLLLAAGLVFVVLRLRAIWDDGHITLSDIRWEFVLAAALAAACGLALSSAVWLAILRLLEVETRREWCAVFLQAQVAKYVPGTVWQYAGRTALGSSNGVPMRPLAASLPIELGASALAAGAFATLLLGWWGLLGLPLVFALLIVVERQVVPRGPALRAGIRAVELYGIVWLFVGASFWLAARSLVPVAAADVPYYMGAFAVAWLVGLVAVFAPGGIGVREAVLVGLLHGKIGAADAVVVAAMSRLVLTFVDLAGASVAYLVLRGTRVPAATALSDAQRAS